MRSDHAEHITELQEAAARHYAAARLLIDVLPSEVRRQQKVANTLAEIARERYEALSSEEDSYNICPANSNGWHGPLKGGWDPEVPDGFATIECGACGLTTGIRIPPVEQIDWGD